MKFYTIQTLEFWEENKNNDFLLNQKAYIDEHFLTPYSWMYHQMVKRIPTVDESMIWVWTKRPDLRRSCYLPKGQAGVLLELDLDLKQVLLSDFDRWHMVLNNAAIKKHEDEVIDKELSWERIFDFDLMKELNKEAYQEIKKLSEGEESFAHTECWEIEEQGVTSKVPLTKVKLIKTFKGR